MQSKRRMHQFAMNHAKVKWRVSLFLVLVVGCFLLLEMAISRLPTGDGKRGSPAKNKRGIFRTDVTTEPIDTDREPPPDKGAAKKTRASERKRNHTSPEAVVKRFYEALNRDDCREAGLIRPGYSRADCLSKSQVVINHCRTLRQERGLGVVCLDLSYEQNGDKKVFSGLVTLEKDEGQEWRIIHDSYHDSLCKDIEQYWQKVQELYGRPAEASSNELSSDDPSPGTGSTSSMSFGSARVLMSCWTADALLGDPVDKRIQKRSKTDCRAPVKVVPSHLSGRLPAKLRNSIRSVAPLRAEKVVSLTFDLCESCGERAGYDYEVVNYLRRENVKATFFGGGKWMRSHPDKTAQLMADPLFEIGNHSWSHANLRISEPETVWNQVMWTQAQYEILYEQLSRKPCFKSAGARETRKIPKSIQIFRFPFGTCNPQALDFLAVNGLPAVQWNIVTGDAAKGQTAERIIRTVSRNLSPGSIVIGHANGRGHGTAEALHTLVPEIRRRGYRFVTVSELLDMGNAFAPRECYENKPGDNHRYDKRRFR